MHLAGSVNETVLSLKRTAGGHSRRVGRQRRLTIIWMHLLSPSGHPTQPLRGGHAEQPLELGTDIYGLAGHRRGDIGDGRDLLDQRFEKCG